MRSNDESNALRFDSFPLCQLETFSSTLSYRRNRSSSSAAAAALNLANDSVAVGPFAPTGLLVRTGVDDRGVGTRRGVDTPDDNTFGLTPSAVSHRRLPSRA